MARADLSTAVRDLIVRHIDSAQQVEILVLLGDDPDLEWTAQDASRRLRIAAGQCEHWLERFAAAGLVERTETGYIHRRRKQPGKATPVDQLIDQYAIRRLAILDLIYSKPNPAIQSFADAFRMREDD